MYPNLQFVSPSHCRAELQELAGKAECQEKLLQKAGTIIVQHKTAHQLKSVDEGEAEKREPVN